MSHEEVPSSTEALFLLPSYSFKKFYVYDRKPHILLLIFPSVVVIFTLVTAIVMSPIKDGIKFLSFFFWTCQSVEKPASKALDVRSHSSRNDDVSQEAQ